jgi:adenylosuccinate lyase
MRAWDEHADFRELIADEPAVSSKLSGAELAELFDYGYFMRHAAYTFRRLGFSTAATGSEVGAKAG